MRFTRESHVFRPTAQLLKRAGYPQNDLDRPGTVYHDTETDGRVLAPTHAQAMQWLRGEHNIVVFIFPDFCAGTLCFKWSVESLEQGGWFSPAYSNDRFDYETAAEEGIKAACRYLTDKESE